MVMENDIESQIQEKVKEPYESISVEGRFGHLSCRSGGRISYFCWQVQLILYFFYTLADRCNGFDAMRYDPWDCQHKV